MNIRGDCNAGKADRTEQRLLPRLLQRRTSPGASDAGRRGNTGTVLDFYDALEAGDLVRAARILGPEVVWHETPGTPYRAAWGGYIGGDEVASEVLAPFRADVAGLVFDTHTLLTYGNTVAALGTYRGRPVALGRELALPCLHTWSFTRDGRITEFRQYTDAAAFRAAIGSREPAG